MDSALIALLANGGVAGVVLVLVLTGQLVPGWLYRRVENEADLLREGRDIDRQRASEASSTAGVTNQLIGALTNLATERRNPARETPSPATDRSPGDISWTDLN